MNKKSLYACAALPLIALCASAANAQDGPEPGTLASAIADTKPLFTSRLRYETVDQEGFDEVANALTLRLRAGFETGALADTKFLVDFDYVEAIVGEFNSTQNLRTQFPVVADPEVTELNRFQLTNTSIKDTTITLGRQRIIEDDARFIGNIGWRQDEQTFDALRVQTTVAAGLTLDIAYVDQVNRIFPQDSPIGVWDSESVLAEANYSVPLEGAKIDVSGFAYLLDFEDDAPGASSQTYGVYVKAAKGPVSGRFRYAVQSDYAEQPTDYTAEYLNAEATYKAGGFALTAGYEELGSDEGTIGFATPLSTAHAFNGFADLFLATPADGLEDIYGTLTWSKKNVGKAKLLKAFVTYHDFSSDVGGTDFGTEWNAVGVASFGRTKLLVKYADYSADQFAGDTEKLWLQVDWGF